MFVFISGCHTVKESGSYPDMPCVMSWTYPINGVTYKGCANPDGDTNGQWCPTEVNAAGEYLLLIGWTGLNRKFLQGASLGV